MRLAFLQPAVLWAALAVAAPVAIHMLSRATSRPVTFPSVRFLEPTRLAAVRWRAIQDWPLLVLRVAIVLLAVVALAGPVLVTPAREAAWRTRVARAIVLDDRTASPDDEMRSAAVAATFARARLRDAVADAVRWLERQTPASRELVVLSAFRRGSTDAADLSAVPASIGIRLVRTADGSPTREREISRLVWRDGRVVRVLERLTLDAQSTRVREISAEPMGQSPIRVIAPSEQQPAADAALRAVLRRGLRLPPAGLLEPLTVEWPGDVEHLADVLESRLAASMDAWEPETLQDTTLASLSRAPKVQEDPAPVDAGDRRVVWSIVVGLLVAELWFRQGASWK